MKFLLRRLAPILLFVGWSFGFYLFHILEHSGLVVIAAGALLNRRAGICMLTGWCFGWLSFTQSKSSEQEPGDVEKLRLITIVTELKPVYTKGVLTGFGKSNLGKVRFKLPLYAWTGVDRISEGSVIQGIARCTRLKTSWNPFDYRFHLRANNVGFICVYQSYSIFIRKNIGSTIKPIVREKVDDLPNFFNVKNLLLSFTLGRLELLTRSQENLFRDTGLFHLLVLSGYQLMVLWHITIRTLNIVRYHLGLRGFRSFLISKLFGLTVLVLYSFVVGLDKPIVRALAFIFFAEICAVFIPNNPLVASAYFVCLFEPGAQFTLSFLLTFSALLGFTLASGLSGVTYIIASSTFASVCSGWVMSLFGYETNGSWVVFNILFGPVLSAVSTAGGIIGVLEYMIFDSVAIWWCVSGITYLVYKLIVFFYDLGLFEFRFEFALFGSLILSFFSISQQKGVHYAKMRFRRQKQKLRSYVLTNHSAATSRLTRK